MVVSIILGILKIIGITLLCILGLILFLLIVVLFVPIRYKVMADSNINDNVKEYHVKAKVSWLLHLVHGKYEYPGEEGFVLKVGPFAVYGKKKKEKPDKKKQTKQKAKEKTSEISENYENKEADLIVQEKTTQDDIMQEEMTQDEYTILEDLQEVENDKKQNRKSLKEKILYTRQKICDKINKMRQKIKDILTNMKKYVGILQSEAFKESFASCKDSLARLFRMIKPRKVKIKGTAGLGSPDTTGYMCAAIGVISPFFKKQIQVIPDFENYVIEGNAVIKGRIYLFVILIIAIKLFFDKNIRKVMDMFHKEEM